MVLSSRASSPVAVLLLPVFFWRANAPVAVLSMPVVLRPRATAPTAVLSMPVVLARAPVPNAELLLLPLVVLTSGVQVLSMSAKTPAQVSLPAAAMPALASTKSKAAAIQP